MQVFAELCACTACSPPPPPCQWPGPFFFFRRGRSIDEGGHVSCFEGAGSIDMHMGGPLTRILVEVWLKSGHLCHWCGHLRGGQEAQEGDSLILR